MYAVLPVGIFIKQFLQKYLGNPLQKGIQHGTYRQSQKDY